MNIAIDMDETLIATRPRHLQETNLPIIRLGMCLGVLENAVVRPHVDEFLTFCKAKFDKVVCCSFSETPRVRLCLSGMNLMRYFDGLYGWDDIVAGNGIGPNLGRFILIDDYDWKKDNLVLTKLRFFGFPNNNENFTDVNEYYMNVSKFTGSDQDSDLLRLIPRLEARLTN